MDDVGCNIPGPLTYEVAGGRDHRLHPEFFISRLQTAQAEVLLSRSNVSVETSRLLSRDGCACSFLCGFRPLRWRETENDAEHNERQGVFPHGHPHAIPLSAAEVVRRSP